MASTISIMIVILVLGIVVDLIFTQDRRRRSRRRRRMLDPAVFVEVGGPPCPPRSVARTVDIRSKHVGFRGHRAGWRAVVADGDAQGGAGVARVDAAAPDGRHSRAGDGRAGRGGAGARPGSAGAAARGTPRSWRTRGRGWGRCRGWPRGWPRWTGGPRSRLSARPTCRSCIRPSSGGCCGQRSRTVRMSGCRWRGGIRSRWPPPTGSALAPVAAKLVAEERLRPAFLFEECVVDAAGRGRAAGLTRYWRRSIPASTRCVNVNEPADYQAGPGASRRRR